MARDKFRSELLNERRNRFYQAYMEKAREKMRIEINQEALKRANLSVADGSSHLNTGGG